MIPSLSHLGSGGVSDQAVPRRLKETRQEMEPQSRSQSHAEPLFVNPFGFDSSQNDSPKHLALSPAHRISS
jgi:hypothetical protein